MTSLPVLYVAPGSGLGHVTRAAAVATELRREGIGVEILTNSLFAAGLRRVTGLDIRFIPSSAWVHEAPSYALAARPALVVLDTFPWGLRAEWTGHRQSSLRFVTIARRLKRDAYLAVAGGPPDGECPHLDRVIVAEPLNEDYSELIQHVGLDIRHLTARIRFPAEGHSTSVPPELDAFLAGERVWLLVHSGPEEEILRLAGRARANMAEQGGGTLVAVLPRPMRGLSCPVFHWFPAASVFSRACRVVTGAGYNCIAETEGLRERHLSIPFPRRYDDQAGRLVGPMMPDEDGAKAAGRIIAEWL